MKLMAEHKAKVDAVQKAKREAKLEKKKRQALANLQQEFANEATYNIIKERIRYGMAKMFQ